MTKRGGRTVRLLFDIVLSASLVIAGLCLIGGCLYIYNVEGAYSREIVAAVFSKIAVPVYVCLALLVVSIVWEAVSPSAVHIRKAPKAYAAARDRLHSTRTLDDAAWAAVDREQACRRRYAVWRLVIAAAALSIFLWYAVQPAHYTADINASVIRAMWVAIPCFVVPAAFAIVAAAQIDKSYQREIALLKPLPRQSQDSPPAPSAKRGDITAVLRFVLLALAVAALIYGFVAGGTVDVLTKAINICTECIGLG